MSHLYRALGLLWMFVGFSCDAVVEQDPVESFFCKAGHEHTDHERISSAQFSPPISAEGPVPTASQEAWQRDERYLFIHFGLNTFVGKEWGEGTDSERLFDPAHIDVEQWAQVAKHAGFEGIILTAKHHEGFALWPTAYSDYSVANSPWQNGQGDLVQLLAEACRREGVKFGIYLSPWDRHEPTYGTEAYNDFFVGQLTELLTGYGPLFEIWLDSAREPGIDFEYDFNRYFETVRALQPEALIANLGPDIRWVGNEEGVVPDQNYSNANGSRWHPAECDVPIRPGWFWKEYEDHQVKSLDDLLSIYYNCIGRNSVLLLGVSPNTEGIIPALDVERLLTFGGRISQIFSNNLLLGQSASASNERGHEGEWVAGHLIDGNQATYWATDEKVRTATVEFSVDPCQGFNVIELIEPIQFGQRIDWHLVEIWQAGQWVPLVQGATVGYKRLHRVGEQWTTRIRLTVWAKNTAPALERVGLYRDVLALSGTDDLSAYEFTSSP